MRVIYVDAIAMIRKLTDALPLKNKEVRIEVETGKVSVTEKGKRPMAVKPLSVRQSTESS